MQHETHPRDTSDSSATHRQTLLDVGVAMQLEIEDLKVARLTEQSAENAIQIGILHPLTERVDLAENQTTKRRHRLPELTDDEDTRTIVTAIEVQEQLRAFKEAIWNKVNEIRLETSSLSKSWYFGTGSQ